MKEMVDILQKIYDLFIDFMELSSGLSNDGGIIVYDAEDNATFKGKYKQINILSDTTFNSLCVDEVDISLSKGYRNLIPAGTILSAGRGRFFTFGSIDSLGMIQCI